MQNWFDIIPPHEDIQSGQFDEAVFAADPGDVDACVAPPDENDLTRFFKRTGARALFCPTPAARGKNQSRPRPDLPKA